MWDSLIVVNHFPEDYYPGCFCLLDAGIYLWFATLSNIGTIRFVDEKPNDFENYILSGPVTDEIMLHLGQAKLIADESYLKNYAL